MEEVIPPIEIPPTSLSAEALLGLIDNFIQREGTDYGMAEISYDTKIQQVKRLIEKGDAKIVFDSTTETVTLLTKLEFRKLALTR